MGDRRRSGCTSSPEVVAQLGLHAPLVIAAALGSLVLGMAYAFILLRLGASMRRPRSPPCPVGPSEMANLADRHGGAVDSASPRRTPSGS